MYITKGGIMQTSNELKQILVKLYKKYYEVEKELKKINNYIIGDDSEADKRSTELVLLWINIRNEIFYNRVKLAKSYETNLKN